MRQRRLWPSVFGPGHNTSMLEAVEVLQRAAADARVEQRVGSRADEDRLESDPRG